MITKINHRNTQTAKSIHLLFQLSYTIEAQWLRSEHFPPLYRTVEDIFKSDTVFYAYLEDEVPVAIIEIKNEKTTTDIHSLVVHPDYFRKGLGITLMTYVLRTMESQVFIVETGLENEAATNLYRKLGFQEVEQWDTSFGVRKIKFQKTKSPTN